MNSSIKYLLTALLDHQQKYCLHSDIEILAGHRETVCTIGEPTSPVFELRAPADTGQALAAFLAKQIKIPLSSEMWREGIIELSDNFGVPTVFTRIVPKTDGYHMVLSAIDNHLKNPNKLFTTQQSIALEDMLNTRAGIIGISGPTLGSTLATLYALERLLQNYASPHHIKLQPMFGMESSKTLHQSAQRLPAFALLMFSDEGTPAIWETIAQTAIAGSVIIVGVPKMNTCLLVKKLRFCIPPFLWDTLFRGTIVHTPFPSACAKCAVPMPLHPDVLEQFSTQTDSASLMKLKSAHALGCEACNFHGRGPNISTIELCAPKHVPEDINISSLEDTLQQKGMQTTIDDLIKRAYETPVPLEKAAKLWKKRRIDNRDFL